MGRQQELLERVVATGTPVVLVVVSGRPLAIELGRRALRRRPAGLGAGRRRARGHRGRPDRRREPRRQAADLDPAPRRTGPRLVPPPPDRWSIQPEGAVRRRPDDAALAVRVRPFVHQFELSNLRLDSGRGPDRGRRGGRDGRRRQQGRSPGRRGRPALRPRCRGERRPAGPRAARVPSRRPRARRERSSCPSTCRSSSSPTPGRTTGGSSSRAPSRCSWGARRWTCRSTTTLDARGTDGPPGGPEPLPDRVPGLADARATIDASAIDRRRRRTAVRVVHRAHGQGGLRRDLRARPPDRRCRRLAGRRARPRPPPRRLARSGIRAATSCRATTGRTASDRARARPVRQDLRVAVDRAEPRRNGRLHRVGPTRPVPSRCWS